MESLNLTGLPQIFLGIYLILHGLIHSLFLMYALDEKTNTYTGWSGKSWFFDTFLNTESVDILGKAIWSVIIILFVVSGLGILGISYIKNYTEILIIIASIVALLAFILFFNGLHPAPYDYLLGIAIDIVLLAYVIIYPHEQTMALISLIVLFLMGMVWVFVTDVLPEIFNSTS